MHVCLIQMSASRTSSIQTVIENLNLNRNRQYQFKNLWLIKYQHSSSNSSIVLIIDFISLQWFHCATTIDFTSFFCLEFFKDCFLSICFARQDLPVARIFTLRRLQPFFPSSSTNIQLIFEQVFFGFDSKLSELASYFDSFHQLQLYIEQQSRMVEQIHKSGVTRIIVLHFPIILWNLLLANSDMKYKSLFINELWTQLSNLFTRMATSPMV